LSLNETDQPNRLKIKTFDFYLLRCRQKLWLISFPLFMILILNLSPALFGQMPASSHDKGSFSLNLENDVFLDDDDGYTSGVELLWVLPRLSGKSSSSFIKWLYKLNIRLLGSNEPGNQIREFSGADQRRAIFSLSQTMFTPDDLEKKEIISDDRPYAGVLHAGITLVRDTGRRQDTLALTIGLVGPHSFAGSIQKWLHKTYDWTYPEGWENQLKDEPFLEMWFSRLWTLVFPTSSGKRLSPAIKAGYGGQLGNLMTAVNAGLDFRFGFNLKPEADSFSTAPFSGQIFLEPSVKTSIYVFLRLEGKAIARNLVLEGNTFTGSHSVEIHPLYAQVTSGIVYRSTYTNLSFYFVLRTKEFKGQKYVDPYAGLTFTFNL
jgi:hypothetical protein